MKEFSHRTRQQNLDQCEDEIYDLMIIGGGINGAGAARDAAMRGMKVFLVEKSDFASGTSSRSSKLVHGGLRYLENMEFHLVFEALNERTVLLEMAPHLVHPLKFMVPLYQHSRVSLNKMDLGLWLYDALSLFQAPEMHERLNSKETVQTIPQINHKELSGSLTYYDAYMDDDRLVIDTLRSANEYGAKCVNYTKAISFAKSETDKGPLYQVGIEDQKIRARKTVKARHVLSTVGPWTDQLGHQLFGQWKDILRPTKGIHLTLDNSHGSIPCAVVMAAEKSDRIAFAIPRHEMIIVGTTDTDYKGDVDNITADRADVDYLLKLFSSYFPKWDYTRNPIIGSYAGIRPLVNDGAKTEGKVSREHSIWTDEHGVSYVAGGKYTTYRLVSHQAVDEVLKAFPSDDRVRFHAQDTRKSLTNGTSFEAFTKAEALVPVWAKETGWSEKDIHRLVQRHGLEAERILNYKIKAGSIWELEAQHALETTMCLELKDFYRRRSPLFLAFADHGMSMMGGIGDVFRKHLQLSDQQLLDMKTRTQNEFDTELQWQRG